MASAVILDGRSLANKILSELKKEIKQCQKTSPGLATVLVGNDEASAIYVAKKQKAASKVGIRSIRHELPENSSEAELLNLILSLNKDPSVDGILVQLPLPKHLKESTIIDALDPDKDVDGFTPLNLGHLLSGDNKIVACTPLGILHLIDSINYSLCGKNVVVVGASTIVGKPLALLLLQRNATVTICHRKTVDLASYTRRADVLISAAGVAGLITKDHVKPQALVIDVGTNRDSQNRICGDVDFQAVKEIASYITPVPGGVGPLTVAMLLKNTLANFKRKNS